MFVLQGGISLWSEDINFTACSKKSYKCTDRLFSDRLDKQRGISKPPRKFKEQRKRNGNRTKNRGWNRKWFSFLLFISTICFVIALGYGGNDRVPSKAMKWKIQFIAGFFLAPRAQGSFCSAGCGFSDTKKLTIFLQMWMEVVVLRILQRCPQNQVEVGLFKNFKTSVLFGCGWSTNKG